MRLLNPSKRTPVALLNLLSQPARTLACILGVSFALLLIFMQLGFRGAVANTANIVYGKLRGDLVLRSPDYVHLYEPRTFDRGWMRMVQGHPGHNILEISWHLFAWLTNSTCFAKGGSHTCLVPHESVHNAPS